MSAAWKEFRIVLSQPFFQIGDAMVLSYIVFCLHFVRVILNKFNLSNLFFMLNLILNLLILILPILNSVISHIHFKFWHIQNIIRFELSTIFYKSHFRNTNARIPHMTRVVHIVKVMTYILLIWFRSQIILHSDISIGWNGSFSPCLS